MTRPPDRRYFRAALGVAHESLRGSVADMRLTEGRWHRIKAPLTDLLAAPNGPRDRQLLAGTRFNALTVADGHIFGFDEDEGLCGWVVAEALGPDAAVSHIVASPGTHAYRAADFKSADNAALSCGVRVAVADVETHPSQGDFAQTSLGFIPMGHLRPVDEVASDPVAVARGFLGTPYLWGGNSRAGIDCSGLVQVAYRACGLRCPADSDMQAQMAGHHLPIKDVQPGDLVFWRGHVAMVTAPDRIIHANAHHMAVVEEPLSTAVARIDARGDPVLHCLRVSV